MKKTMSTKTILIIIGIILLLIVGIFAFIKLVPFWVTLTAAGSFLSGGVIGAYFYNLYLKHWKGYDFVPTDLFIKDQK